MCGEGMPAFYSEGKYVEHSCEGFLMPLVLRQFGLCQSIRDYHFKQDKNGWPLVEECTKNFFAFYYPTTESMSAFDRLYKNVNGLQDKFLAYWDLVA